MESSNPRLIEHAGGDPIARPELVPLSRGSGPKLLLMPRRLVNYFAGPDVSRPTLGGRTAAPRRGIKQIQETAATNSAGAGKQE